jgi:HemY protein
MQDAARRLPGQPLTKLLKAQTAQLRGNRAEARDVFQEMAEDPETRIAGLRGLYIEAEREGEHLAAQQIAERARAEAPSAPWAARALLRHQTAAGEWDEALRTLTGAVDARILDKRTARRQRAVILTAKALALEDGEPDQARQAALEAHDLAADLVPAAVVAGRLLARQGDIRRATRVLEAAWKAEPHPEIADAYLHVRSGDAASDRLKRAETLLRMRTHADEARQAVARAAIDAREFARAREVLTPLLTERPTQKALLLMADLEEAESGDLGRARAWQARAVYAPRDPAWTADGVVLEEWAPMSPVTGNLDAVEWKVPVTEIEGPRLEIDAADLTPLPPAAVNADTEESEVEATRSDGGDGSTQTPDETAEQPHEPAEVVTVVSTDATPDDSGTPPKRFESGTADSRERAADRSPAASEETTSTPPEPTPQAANDTTETADAEPPRPDDPGVGNEEDEDAKQSPALPEFLSPNSSATRRRA